jgi:hypothetical protein
LIVAASAWLFASAVRHHNMWTPTALTIIDARARLEIAKPTPIRMTIGDFFKHRRPKSVPIVAEVCLRSNPAMSDYIRPHWRERATLLTGGFGPDFR